MIVGGITTYDYFGWGDIVGCGIPEAEDDFMSSVRRGGEEGFHGGLSHPGPDLLDIRPELEVGVARVRNKGGRSDLPFCRKSGLRGHRLFRWRLG